MIKKLGVVRSLLGWGVFAFVTVFANSSLAKTIEMPIDLRTVSTEEPPNFIDRTRGKLSRLFSSQTPLHLRSSRSILAMTPKILLQYPLSSGGPAMQEWISEAGARLNGNDIHELMQFVGNEELAKANHLYRDGLTSLSLFLTRRFNTEKHPDLEHCVRFTQNQTFALQLLARYDEVRRQTHPEFSSAFSYDAGLRYLDTFARRTDREEFNGQDPIHDRKATNLKIIFLSALQFGPYDALAVFLTKVFKLNLVDQADFLLLVDQRKKLSLINIDYPESEDSALVISAILLSFINKKKPEPSVMKHLFMNELKMRFTQNARDPSLFPLTVHRINALLNAAMSYFIRTGNRELVNYFESDIASECEEWIKGQELLWHEHLIIQPLINVINHLEAQGSDLVDYKIKKRKFFDYEGPVVLVKIKVKTEFIEPHLHKMLSAAAQSGIPLVFELSDNKVLMRAVFEEGSYEPQSFGLQGRLTVLFRKPLVAKRPCEDKLDRAQN